MRLLCALVTHNRLDYTQASLTSWAATAGPDDHLVIFDNASTDGTREWLERPAAIAMADTIILWPDNLFPGAAVNRAWHEGLKLGEFDLLQRSDNDIRYREGWRQEVESAFLAHPNLGQLGILNRHEDYDDQQPVTRLEKNGYAVNVEWPRVGGNSVIPRRLWDDGLRWQPGAWVPNSAYCEDAVMSAEIAARGLTVAELIPTVADNLSYHRYEDYPDYYDRTAAIRGLVPELSV